MDLPVELPKATHMEPSNVIHMLCSMDDNDHPIYSQCILLRKCNMEFILACNASVFNDTFVIINEQHLHTVVFRCIPELDIILLKISDEIYGDDCKGDAFDIDYLDIDSLKFQEFPQMANVLFVDNTSILSIQVQCVTHNEHLKSLMTPKIPYIIYTSPITIAGSPLVQDNQIIAITIAEKNDSIYALPICIVNYFLFCDSMYSCGFDTNVIEVDDDGQKYTALLVNNDVGGLRSGSVITHVNGHSFDENGCIYMNDINFGVTFELYCAICCAHDYKIEYKTCCDDDNKSQQLAQQVASHITHIRPQLLKNTYAIDIHFDNKYYQYCGVTFCKLSEELLVELHNCGVNLVGNLYEKYYKKNKSSNPLIVVCSIEPCVTINSDVFTIANTTFVRYDDTYSLLLLHRIGNKMGDIEMITSCYTHDAITLVDFKGRVYNVSINHGETLVKCH